MEVEILLDDTDEIDLVKVAGLEANAVAKLIEPDTASITVRDFARDDCIVSLVVFSSVLVCVSHK